MILKWQWYKKSKEKFEWPGFLDKTLKSKPWFSYLKHNNQASFKKFEKIFPLCIFCLNSQKSPKRLWNSCLTKPTFPIGSCSYDGDVSVAVPDVVVPDGNVTQIFTELLELKKYEDGYQVVHIIFCVPKIQIYIDFSPLLKYQYCNMIW